MKAWFLIVFVVACGFSSCKKESGISPPDETPNTWQYKGVTQKAAYSDIIAKSGFTLVFHPEPASGLANSLSFIFRSRPASDQLYNASKDTSQANAVMIHLETENIGDYNSIGNDTGAVRVFIKNGKLKLLAYDIRMLRDSTTGAATDSLKLSFNLLEF